MATRSTRFADTNPNPSRVVSFSQSTRSLFPNKQVHHREKRIRARNERVKNVAQIDSVMIWNVHESRIMIFMIHRLLNINGCSSLPLCPFDVVSPCQKFIVRFCRRIDVVVNRRNRSFHWIICDSFELTDTKSSDLHKYEDLGRPKVLHYFSSGKNVISIYSQSSVRRRRMRRT